MTTAKDLSGTWSVAAFHRAIAQIERLADDENFVPTLSRDAHLFGAEDLVKGARVAFEAADGQLRIGTVLDGLADPETARVIVPADDPVERLQRVPHAAIRAGTQLEGGVREPSIETVVTLAKALGVPVGHLLE